MARPADRTFIVESYVPQLDERAATARTTRLRAAVRQLNATGKPTRLLRSFTLLEDETHLCLVAARDRGDAIALFGQAGLANDHVTEALAIDTCANVCETPFQ